ncbi:hypothetical protein NI389_13865 [Pseudoalteromonas xiamenensis]|uniref:hypothetical protein n=1 Tax=Pseudoalteromonas xiamenensis TaxID=882626 RepID=UPI0027E56F24|nr:hypothetical protein [Pseudoalteromonas xiamenensis]WMN59287.1 hypothetical protein NI389_13865 [Pseudoalteromonas xiamenensis]
MSKFESTPNRGYPLPHKENLLQHDVQRLRTTITEIDVDVQESRESNELLQQRLESLQRRVRLTQLLGDEISL